MRNVSAPEMRQSADQPHPLKTGPNVILRTVAGHRVGRPINAELRVREHLTPSEVEALAQAAKQRGRYGYRDALIIRMAARHGFRVSEIAELRWDQIDLKTGLIYVARKKNGRPSTHPLSGEEVRALRQLRRDWPYGRQVFVTERGAPFTRSGLAKMVERRLRPSLCQPRRRHSSATAVAGSQEHPAHGALFRAQRRAV